MGEVEGEGWGKQLISTGQRVQSELQKVLQGGKGLLQLLPRGLECLGGFSSAPRVCVGGLPCSVLGPGRRWGDRWLWLRSILSLTVSYTGPQRSAVKTT